MAQRTEKEETEFKAVPETLTLCVICGVTGNSATKNMCHNCFTATTSSAAIVNPSHKFPTAADCGRSPRSTSRSEEIRRSPTARDRAVLGVGSAAAKREVNRCSGCRRKVGLTGFRCRCGDLFCADHRYSDRHECSYDYKAAGRAAIARENPVVKAAKIVRV